MYVETIKIYFNRRQRRFQSNTSARPILPHNTNNRHCTVALPVIFVVEFARKITINFKNFQRALLDNIINQL